MPNRNITDNPTDKKYNDDYFSGIKKTEKNGSFPGADGNAGIDGVRDAEANPEKGYINKVVGKSLAKSGGPMSFIKKKGPLLAIILTLVGGGLGLTTILAPATILFQFVATEVGHFNTQLASMDARSISMYADKTTGGIACGVVLNILCKYSTMSDKQIANFEDAGINVEADGSTIFGRIKPKNFIFDNEAIPANEFKNAMKTNPDFAQAVDEAYNPKYAGFSDNVFVQWVEQKLGITKAAENLSGDTPEEQLASLEKDVNVPADTSADIPALGTEKPDGSGQYTQPEIDAMTAEAAEMTTEAAAITASGETTSLGIMQSAKAAINANASLIGGTLMATGLANVACTAYGTLQAVGYAAKTIRSDQLDKFAWAPLNVESQARAGVASEKDMTFMGNLLTTATKDENGNMTSATDSFGYRYASSGLSGAGAMPTSSTRFMAGGGLTGSLLNLHTIISDILQGTPSSVCGFVQNPFVMGVSLVAGLALLAANPPAGLGKIALQAAPMLALYGGMMILPALLKDIIAGVLIDKTTTGAAAGDALTSGISGLMSKAAAAGGNAPLTPTQAVAYQNMSNDIAEKYAEKDRLAYSPLDPTNKNTFMGKIANQLMPYVSKMSSLAGILSSVASITTGSLASITAPSTRAASTDDFTQCQDEDYKALHVATDPFCNVVYGIPPDALNTSPVTVAKTLLSQGQIDPDKGEPVAGSEYASFVTECINRADPLGNKGSNTTGNGSNCLFNSKNQNYYLHYIDQRVQADMDGETLANNPAGSSATGLAPSGNTRPDNVVDKGKGWGLKSGIDYSGVACADGSTDSDTYLHPTEKFTIRKCDTALGEVSSLISQKVVDMVKAAKADGVNLVGSSWRSYESQQQLYIDNCKRGHCDTPTAKPGNSQHERGLATDFGAADKGGKVWNWLSANGAKYGYINFPAESWHWSMSGT